ncbi:putative bifunctional diguanylate cyclase/phosphodiesterase [Methylocaldum sp.]|uniref:putative bifunctional diguanylate cyclase/phosphodiesterase n=1 Tax=Methylocaldum sp. TaxID=1969727 RepID=UPI002D68C725|nr:EAL domain-containing protein [Methylocaldum sp.]HYE36752.1 EAL domain-containing protein [Methylocaldum sp.]
MTGIDLERLNQSALASGPDTERTVKRMALLLFPLGLFAFGLWLFTPGTAIRFSHYPAIHTVAEISAVVIAMMVFGIGWSAYDSNRPLSQPILACGFLTIGLLDLMHTLSFPGMPDFVTPNSPEKAINFWLVARYVAAAVLLATALLPWRPMNRAGLRRLMLAGSLAFTSLIAWFGLFREDLWPRTFLPGQGLTPFEVKAEYTLAFIYLIIALILLCRLRRPQPIVLVYLMGASAVTALSELCLSRYRAVNDLCNLVGHVYKAVAYFLVYRGVFVDGVREPYLRLQISREALRKSEARFQDLLKFEPDGILLTDSAGNIVMANAKAVARDIAEQKQYEAMLKFQATHDSLTALPNRSLFRNRLERAMLRAQRAGGLVAVLLVDLDDFKNVNDTLGHNIGDELVKLIGARLKAALREGDTVARLGGDEFAVLLPHIADPLFAGRKAQALLDAIAQPCRIENHYIFISASIGITLYPNDGDDVHGLLRNADMSMYKAKEEEEERCKFQFYTAEMDARLQERLEIVNDLRKALDQGEFTLHYQPRVSLVTGRICGVEALIRWRHPEKGSIAPGKFIPIAEETGLIVPIGNWVFRTACAQAKAWRDKGLSFNRMAVNLSARQFAQPDLVEVVAAIVDQTGLSPQTLELEITESMLMRDRSMAIEVLRRLKQLGVYLAVDDFGTGYSSLSYLKQFPLDYLKIDQSFVRDLIEDPDDARIVEAIIVLAHSLNLGVIAEGTETPEQIAFLRARRCDEMQGYYFSKPAPADEVEAMLATGKSLELAIASPPFSLIP